MFHTYFRFLRHSFFFGIGIVRVQNHGFRHLERLFTGFDARSGIKGIVKLPSDDTSAVPVDDGCKIQEAVLHRDISDVYRPRHVGTVDLRVPEKIRSSEGILKDWALDRSDLWPSRSSNVWLFSFRCGSRVPSAARTSAWLPMSGGLCGGDQ